MIDDSDVILAKTRQELLDLKDSSTKRLDKIEEILMKLVRVTSEQAKAIKRSEQDERKIVDLEVLNAKNTEAIQKISKISYGIFLLLSLEFVTTTALIALKLFLKL